jgi:stage II sporulation protein D
MVRVLLAEREGVTVLFDGPHAGALDGRLFETSLPLAWPVAVVGERLLVDGLEVGQVLDLTSAEGVAWNGGHYRGTLRLRASGGKILVINVLDLESYLRGVVPAEMQANWHPEALKAQAVAARTYTLRYLRSDQPYDICATIDCQVYAGVRAEHPGSDAAVAATAGEVLSFNGALARVYYHSDSGGATASSAEVWGEPRPYLPAQPDVATRSPHADWTARLNPQVASTWLATIGVNIGALESLRVLETSSSGRVVRAELVGSRGRVVLDGVRLRTQLRGWGLRSTRFVMTGALSVRGQGWGHGVGMSQYGALALAEGGRDYRSILANYYPGTAIEPLVELLERAAVVAHTP